MFNLATNQLWFPNFYFYLWLLLLEKRSPIFNRKSFDKIMLLVSKVGKNDLGAVPQWRLGKHHLPGCSFNDGLEMRPGTWSLSKWWETIFAIKLIIATHYLISKDFVNFVS